MSLSGSCWLRLLWPAYRPADCSPHELPTVHIYLPRMCPAFLPREQSQAVESVILDMAHGAPHATTCPMGDRN